MPGSHRLSQAYKRYLSERRYWKRVCREEKKKGNQLFIETQVVSGPRNKNNDPVLTHPNTDDESDTEDIVPSTQELLKYAASESDADSEAEFGTNNIDDNELVGECPKEANDRKRKVARATRSSARNAGAVNVSVGTTNSATIQTEQLEPRPGPSGTCQGPGAATRSKTGPPPLAGPFKGKPPTKMEGK